MNINLNRRKISFILCSIATLLVVVHSIVLGIYFYIDDSDTFDFIRLIDLDYEGNIPTLFSVFLFIVSGALFALIYRAEKLSESKYALYWLGLSYIFIFLGVDEGSRLHEEIGDLFEELVDSSGLLYFPWVIPYGIAFLLATAIYFRFYLTLERSLQIRLFLCASLFLGGAIGVEMLSAVQADKLGTSSWPYSILYTIEESLEMAGLILLIDTLMRRIKQIKGDISLIII